MHTATDLVIFTAIASTPATHGPGLLLADTSAGLRADCALVERS